MRRHEPLNMTRIREALQAYQPEKKPVNERGHAAVAMLLRERDSRPEVLFIVRALHEQDPWSGNIGFPGGRLSYAEETPQQAAERETLEELAVDLQQARWLGQLDDLYGAIMPVLVSCFVYQTEEPLLLQPNYEIAKTFWCPLATLLEPARHQHETFAYRGLKRTHPVVDLLGEEQPFLWGITFRLLQNFFAACDLPFGPNPSGQQ
jgi:8-oxo-dGTP pyrophosphatase MutT (NUDIX family)